MTPKEVHQKYKDILSMLSRGSLKEAMELISELSRELGDTGAIRSLENMQQNYRYMLQYYLDGVTDPERAALYKRLLAGVFTLSEQTRETLLTRDSNNFEFSQKRFFPHTTQFSAEAVMRKLLRETGGDAAQVQRDYEEAVRYLFNYFWLTSDYEQDGVGGLFEQIMSDDFSDSSAKSMLVSALTLNLWRRFDEDKLMLLIDATAVNDMQSRQRAMVGLVFVLARYNRFLPLFPKVRNRIVLMADDSNVVENLENIMMQIIATTETDEITKRLHEEIFPELMKLRPLMEEGLTGDNPLGLDEWGDINPEWQEMLEGSGAHDMIQELADMEMSGADVYMSSFSMLKFFPFFNEFSNWFLPFDTRHSAVSELFDGEEKTLLATFVNSPAMCNSDRYSFCMSVLQMPEAQRGMMKHNFGEAAEQMEEMTKDEAILTPNLRAKTISKHYVQDLFRFFKLSPRRNDFSNMFNNALVMHRTYLFDLLAAEDSIRRNVAEFYFLKKLYPQAIDLFEQLEKEGDVSAEFYQKLGHAYQQNSQISKALEAYKKADLIKPDDFWTNRKIAFCYRLTGDTEAALRSYRHADFIKSGNLSVRLQIVNCLADLDRNEEALNELTQLHAEHGDNARLLRATMRIAFAAHNMAQAEYYAGQLCDLEESTAADWHFAGIIAWMMNKNKLAKERFAKTLKLLDNGWGEFVELFKQVKPMLLAGGIEEDEYTLLVDALAFGLNE